MSEDEHENNIVRGPGHDLNARARKRFHAVLEREERLRTMRGRLEDWLQKTRQRKWTAAEVADVSVRTVLIAGLLFFSFKTATDEGFRESVRASWTQDSK
jgi:hypothetical protein